MSAPSLHRESTNSLIVTCHASRVSVGCMTVYDGFLMFSLVILSKMRG